MAPSPYANSAPEFKCCTLNAFPNTNALLQKSKLPLGLVMQPFRIQRPDEVLIDSFFLSFFLFLFLFILLLFFLLFVSCQFSGSLMFLLPFSSFFLFFSSFSFFLSLFFLLDLKEPVPIVNATTIVRCRRCRTYINPFVSFVDQGVRWRCNICSSLNEGSIDVLFNVVFSIVIVSNF